MCGLVLQMLCAHLHGGHEFGKGIRVWQEVGEEKVTSNSVFLVLRLRVVLLVLAHRFQGLFWMDLLVKRCDERLLHPIGTPTVFQHQQLGGRL